MKKLFISQPMRGRTDEAISITENAGLMGVPVPDRLMAAIDVLQGKGDDV